MRPKRPDSSLQPTIRTAQNTRFPACLPDHLSVGCCPCYPSEKGTLINKLKLLFVGPRRPFLLLNVNRRWLIRFVNDIGLGLAIDHCLVQHDFLRSQR